MSGTAEGAVRARLLSLLDALRSGENPVHGVHDGAVARASVPHISIGAAQGEPWGTKDRPGRAVRVTVTLMSGGDRRDEAAAARMEAVAATVREYNAACASGHDPRFGRDPQTLQPIARPPYYAIEVIPGIVCTGGGGRRNIESEVLDHGSRPIRRLYEAGELGSMFSDLYQNGSYLTEAMISGRAAGRNVVQQRAWGS